MKSKDKLVFTEEIEKFNKDGTSNFIVGKEYDFEYDTYERYTYKDIIVRECYKVIDEDNEEFLMQDIYNGILFNIIKM